MSAIFTNSQLYFDIFSSSWQAVVDPAYSSVVCAVLCHLHALCFTLLCCLVLRCGVPCCAVLQDAAGHHSSALFVQWVPYELAGTTWEAEEEKYVQHLINLVDDFAPGERRKQAPFPSVSQFIIQWHAD
jgi:hypothetical protein